MIEAKYTKLFKDWLYTNTTEPPLPVVVIREVLITYFTNKYDNVEADELMKMLESVYNFYEIGDNDNMFNFVINTFDEYGKYYSEIITNYKKAYDYALNNKRVITKSDKLNMVGNTNISNEQNGSTTRYDLPNKVVPTSNWRSTPSDITDTEESSYNNKDYTNDTTRDSTTTTEFNNEFIDLKNKYMNQIRNVYREFAMKFKDCFYQVY